MLSLLRLISLRHLFGSPLRSLLTIIGVSVGVATSVGITTINRSVLASFRSTVDTIAGKAELTVTQSLSGFDDATVERVKAVPGVLHASGAMTAVAPVLGAPGQSLYVMGLDLLDDGHFRTWGGVDGDVGAIGSDLEFLNSTDRILLSERFARDRGLGVGDAFELVTPTGAQTFMVHALIREEGPIKAFGGWVGVMDLASAQAAFDRGRNLDRIDVAIDPAIGLERVSEALQRELGPSFTVERPKQRGATVEKMLRTFQMGLNLGSGVALLVGIFLVYNTIAIGVVQRRREIGTLRSLGASRLAIRTLFTLEALLLGAVGTLLGAPFGTAVARLAMGAVAGSVSAIYVKVNVTDIQAGPLELMLGVLMGLGGSVFAALRPSVQASSVPPIEALRKDVAAGVDAQGLRSLPAILGVACLLLAWPLTKLPAPAENVPLGGYLSVFAVLIGAALLSPQLLRVMRHVFAAPGGRLLGIAGRLAADNLARAPVRTAVPVSALALGVAMTVCIGGFVNSFQRSSERWIAQSVPADLFITASSRVGGVQNMPLASSLGAEFERLEGVAAVDPVRMFQHEVLELRILVITLTPEIYELHAQPLYLEGRRPTPEQRAEGWVTISENLSRRRNLHPGDVIPVKTPTGLQQYRVSGVVVDYTNDQGTLYLSRARFLEDFRDDRVDTYELYLEEGAEVEPVRRAIQAAYGAKYDLFVLSNSELRDEALGMIDGAFQVTYAMELVAILLALLGVITTLLAAVLDRTREIGLLRAVGATKGLVLRLFTAEAAFIGLTGGLLGCVSGAVMGAIVTDVIGKQSMGWHFDYHFPWSLGLQVGLASAVCALLAGLYPAKRAAGLDVVEALAYE